jgi:antitoxin (DNA-binding transcriptional repressor) of toxin-antitoxin stability system
MNETAIPVAEAAKDFLKLLDLVERKRESAILMREGKAVATLNPAPGPALTSVEVADRWEKLDKLPPDEANAFADDLEAARRHLPPLRSAWD